MYKLIWEIEFIKNEWSFDGYLQKYWLSENTQRLNRLEKEK